jgi:SET domain-containing protein
MSTSQTTILILSPLEMSQTSIDQSQIHAIGTFADSDISKGSLVRVLSGDIVDFKEIIRRIKAGKLNADDPLQISDELFVDLDSDSLAVNHSCNPNAGVRHQNELVALRDVIAGEEITFDYSSTVSSRVSAKGWSMNCNCGAANCRSRLGNVLTIPLAQLEFYANSNGLQDYILEEFQKGQKKPWWKFR